MYTFYRNYETMAQGCFTNSLEKEYYHNIPASMNGSLLTLCPTANKHIIKHLTPATIDAFTINSPFADCLGQSMCEMCLQQEYVKDGVNSSFNLLNIAEYQAVLDDDGFESGTDLSPLKHQQKFLRQLEQQQERKQSKQKHASASFTSPPTKKQSATHATTLFRIEDDDDDISSHSQQHPQQHKQVQFNLHQQCQHQLLQSHSFSSSNNSNISNNTCPAAKNQQPAHPGPSLGRPPLLPATPYRTPFAATPAPQFATQFNFMAPPVPPRGPPSPSFSLHTHSTPQHTPYQLLSPTRSCSRQPLQLLLHNNLNNRPHLCQPLTSRTQRLLMAATRLTGSWLSYP
jgi:hypothetical protein